MSLWRDMARDAGMEPLDEAERYVDERMREEADEADREQAAACNATHDAVLEWMTEHGDTGCPICGGHPLDHNLGGVLS